MIPADHYCKFGACLNIITYGIYCKEHQVHSDEHGRRDLKAERNKKMKEYEDYGHRSVSIEYADEMI